MLRLLLAVALLGAALAPARAQPSNENMQCYMLNGKQVCCFKIGNQIVCQ